MKFQNHILTFVRTDRQAQSNMHLQLFQSWGHKKTCELAHIGTKFVLITTQ